MSGTLKYLKISTKTNRLSTDKLCSNIYLEWSLWKEQYKIKTNSGKTSKFNAGLHTDKTIWIIKTILGKTNAEI